MNTQLCLRLSPARVPWNSWRMLCEQAGSQSMGTSTHVISGIDFSQLKPRPSLHRWQQRWQQRHWCSAWNQTVACCRLQDATILHIWHVNTVTDMLKQPKCQRGVAADLAGKWMKSSDVATCLSWTDHLHFRTLETANLWDGVFVHQISHPTFTFCGNVFLWWYPLSCCWLSQPHCSTFVLKT